MSHNVYNCVLYYGCCNQPVHIYTTIGALSSKFEEFLAVRSQFESDYGVGFLRLHVANPRPLCDRFLRFIVRCFFYEKKE